jgi:serine/threonine-protein kinase RsbW
MENRSNGARHHDILRGLDEVDRIQAIVCELMEESGFASRDIFSVRLAIDESLNNAIKHGNQLDPSKHVRVEFDVHDDFVWIQVEDQGDGFVISQVPDPTAPDYIERPGGRGVHIIQKFMSVVEYNDRGNCVTMWKHRSHS